ncbi:nad4 (mitochondrion) [Ostreococcus tauri]|uniref:NADH-ubiquinone oxidoreductase chain 4 n=1 Tax=Ostreococcus tauri TaxID=70448 RepID=Q0P3F6_OSTTA|nr:nad4 [Ostreococcus tauri]AGR42714.1 NADH dehydrogenase subunit 4 [Ostreococcus tauri]AGR42757.1 NADH dehydrogenase subunit 4 [Ostreococcus tauri]AGR42800.1 NADH dehydrogenase subunit 4 [Ostreococcus tauri]AGR42886.1 NADH dehydrogenase subunit 4 [Ostreococcus tauri]AGR42929.1 NADH dehydrogenase subunit 4 [Ostreococcus tauri]|eukprot:YP_717299.1 nad4 (mitochondrion) [Ostreococcus tauri]
MFIQNILFVLLCLPVLGAVGLLFFPKTAVRQMKLFALNISLVTFVCSLNLWIFFDNSTAKFQFVQHMDWLSVLNMNFYVGIDGISLFFMILTTFLVPVCLLISWQSVKHLVREFLVAFLLLESFMLAVFCMLDLLLFYVFFESVLIPMFLIIGVWGSRERKIRAAYQFFLYTLIGSLFMLLAILLIYFQVGTTDLQVLHTVEFSERRQLFLWVAFFLSFAVKVPMIPFHIWLPEAHVEAPTSGSVILAGILLKLGTYGFLRFSIPLFPEATIYFTPLIYTMSVIGIIYASFTTLRQIDLKKIIAYSSVAHMGFVTLGLFSLNMQGVEGAVLLMLSHGFVASALFLCIGILYDRTHTRLIKYYGGLVQTMPLFAFFFFIFTLGNLSLPGTSSFVGEFLILVGVFQTNTFIATLAATGMILGGAYSIWLYNRVVFGNLKPVYINQFADINRREFFILLPFVVCIFWMGIYPSIFLESLHYSVATVLQSIRI